MTELALILIGALLVNNFVLAQFLGLCPFLGVTTQLSQTAVMALATSFVLTFSALASHLLHQYLLLPFGLAWLRIIVFITVIASAVQFTELYLRATSSVAHRRLGIYLPLITTNCAVLGVALMVAGERLSLAETVLFGIGAASGFSGVLIVFAAMRERLEASDVPVAFRGAPVALVSAGILSLGFLGFSGLV